MARSVKILHAAIPSLCQRSQSTPPAKGAQDSVMPDADADPEKDGDVKMTEKDAGMLQSIAEATISPSNCYVYMRLTFFPRPGTAELGAAVYAPSSADPSTEGRFSLLMKRAYLATPGKVLRKEGIT